MKAQIVSFHCVLTDKIGKILSSTFNQNVITYVKDKGELLQGLAEGLQNLQRGEKRQIILSAAQAYGFYDPNLVVEVLRRELPHGGALRIGDQVLSQSNGKEFKVFRVTETLGNLVTLDGNHPLAGQDLIFDVEGVEIRDATSQEVNDSCSKSEPQYYH